MAPWSLRKLFMAYRRFIPQRGRERIYNRKFFKVNALRKGRSGTYSQEGTCLECSQVEGNIKAIVVTLKEASYLGSRQRKDYPPKAA